MQPLSATGRKRFAASAVVVAVSIVVVALAACVNHFQEFFFIADKAPLILSCITLAVYSVILTLDICGANSFLARAPFVLFFEFVLSILWLVVNAFSTSRWKNIPIKCSSIPKQYLSERQWCQCLQALKSFVWIEWIIILLAFAFTLHTCLRHHAHGNTHVWSVPLARYDPRRGPSLRSSEFLQYPSQARDQVFGTIAPYPPFAHPQDRNSDATLDGGPGVPHMAEKRTSALTENDNDPFARGPATVELSGPNINQSRFKYSSTRSYNPTSGYTGPFSDIYSDADTVRASALPTHVTRTVNDAEVASLPPVVRMQDSLRRGSGLSADSTSQYSGDCDENSMYSRAGYPGFGAPLVHLAALTASPVMHNAGLAPLYGSPQYGVPPSPAYSGSVQMGMAYGEPGRDSLPGGPGLVNVGAAPGGWGGFVRM